MKVHIQKEHTEEQHQAIFECETCEKTFTTEPSLKQHTNSKHAKHKERQNLPVGHPERVRDQESVSLMSMRNACNICGCRFQYQNQVEAHMREHNTNQQGFERRQARKSCRYFRRGYCLKGNQCAFEHSEQTQNHTPACNKGLECRYLYQNRCSFFHPGIGVQKPQNMQDFRFGRRNKRPPMSSNNMNDWMNY